MNILFVSIAAPPKSGAESLQVGKYLHHLTKKAAITLVTTPVLDIGWKKKDESQFYALEGVKETIEINTISSFGRWGSFVSKKLFSKWLNKPDTDFLFHWKREAVLKRISSKPDVIYSRSTPFSSAILADRLKQKLNVPWLMHLSDPWTDSPYGNYKNPYNIAAEKECFGKADLISFTTTEALSFYSEKYPGYKSKFFVSPNVFDRTDLAYEQFFFQHEKLTLMHSGNLYGKRTIEPLLRSLEMLSEAERDSIEVALAGYLDDNNNQLITDSAVKCISKLGTVSASESYELQRKADILISIDKPLEQSVDKVFLPSKIQDYIAARKFILAFTGQGSATYNTVHDKYGVCIDHDKPEYTAEFLRKAISAFNQRDNFFFRIAEPDDRFEAGYNAGLLFERLNTISHLKQRLHS